MHKMLHQVIISMTSDSNNLNKRKYVHAILSSRLFPLSEENPRRLPRFHPWMSLNLGHEPWISILFLPIVS